MRDYDIIGRADHHKGGGRLSLGGRTLYSGDRIEYLSYGHNWISVRYEYNPREDDQPTLHADDGESWLLGKNDYLRWPLPKSRLGKWLWRLEKKWSQST